MYSLVIRRQKSTSDRPFSSTTDARALVRLQCDHVNRSLVPAFYRYLQAQNNDAILTGAKEYHESLQGLTALLERAERETGGMACGLWCDVGELDLLDVTAGPCTSSKVILEVELRC